MSWSAQGQVAHPGTRAGLARVAAHVLSRALSDATGRIGLRPAPGGVATPPFGAGRRVVRTAGAHLLVEQSGRVRVAPLTTLEAAAAFAGVDLGPALDLGPSTPQVGDPAAALGVEEGPAHAIAGAFVLGQGVLDEVVTRLAPAAAPSICQLWPEHFDLACDVGVGPRPDARANLGLSPGDDDHPGPYLYLGPWGAERPGDPAHWNAPFGARLALSHLPPDDAPARAAAVAWLMHGLALLDAPLAPHPLGGPHDG